MEDSGGKELGSKTNLLAQSIAFRQLGCALCLISMRYVHMVCGVGIPGVLSVPKTKFLARFQHHFASPAPLQNVRVAQKGCRVSPGG